jgi:hypothetical protein
MPPDSIPENILQFIWQHQIWLPQTHRFLPFRVVDPGEINHFSGPDFSSAVIRFDDHEAHGSVEIHRYASDWFRHRHHTDPAYDCVILHVVEYADAHAITPCGSMPFTWCMKGRYPTTVVERYQQFMSQLHPIACKNNLKTLTPKLKESWVFKLAGKRVESRFDSIQWFVENTNFDWDWAFRLWVLQQLGHRPNKSGFEYLARHLISCLATLKRSDLSHSGEALILGLAGLLERDNPEPYPNQLKTVFDHYRTVDQLEPILPVWKYMRVRPNRYPDIMLAGWCGILPVLRFEPKQLQHWILKPHSFHQWLNQHLPNPYWETHFRIGKKGPRRELRFSNGIAEHLIINALIPFLGYWQHAIGKSSASKCHEFLELLRWENNAVTREWKSFGIDSENALQSQGLYHLYHHFCKEKRCLECEWGQNFMKR